MGGTILDANGMSAPIGLFDTQEAAAHAVNAAIRRAGLERKRRQTNPVVDGQLVPRARNASGHARQAPPLLPISRHAVAARPPQLGRV